MLAENPTFWKKCSNCKKEIPFKGIYQACSVSTCNHARRGLYFCSVSCWSAHVPLLRHREAYALEKTAPSREEYLRTVEIENAAENAAENARENTTAPANDPRMPMTDNQPKKVFMTGGAPVAPKSVEGLSAEFTKDVLVVVSKLKNYIKERGDMNTAADVNDRLSDRLRQLCDQAIENARADGRKTVMARDFR